ncbi:MAG: DUF3276 family protein [Cryomorphaceae bacterium]|nr:MAG: DUF3276 family protein [Cryomorphaceae bacterium]
MSDHGANRKSREDVFSKAVRAGKRTYFFDVKSTRGNDLYLTITESKKRYSDNGDTFYEKHKLFLYKEDFEKFIEGLQDTIDEIYELRNGNGIYNNGREDHPDGELGNRAAETLEQYNDVSFDDLGKTGE